MHSNVVRTTASSRFPARLAPSVRGRVHVLVVLTCAALSFHPTLAGTTPVAAQLPAVGQVEGRVVTSSAGAPIAGTTVEVAGSSLRAVTDGSGRFILRGVPTGTATLAFQRLGYVTYRRQVDVVEGGRAVVDARLIEEPIGLDPLVVLSQRTRMVGDPLTLAAIPGSAHFLGPDDLEGRKLAFDDAHQILRRIPGVNVQDEEGFGLRPNIGLRGTGVERSAKVTLMEDGVLIAPAPYAAPAAYYFPVMGRMDAVEVRKGSSQIRYGPRTIGGAINMISAPISDRPSWRLDTQGGIDGQLKVRARGAGSSDHLGWMVETYQLLTEGFKELPGGGDTGFRVGDIRAKLRVNSDRDAPRYQELELKLGRHDERSHETYLGLTDADFALNPFLRYPASRPDRMDAEHRQLQLRHFFQPTRRLDFTTTAYHNEFARNWYKLQNVQGVAIARILDEPDVHADALAVIRGAPSGDDALFVRANNREYLSRGLQTVVGLALDVAGTMHAFEMGARVHRDSEDRFQWEDGYRMSGGVPVLTSKGVPGTQANRVSEARARSLYLVDEIRVGPWTIVPGIRHEHVEMTRIDYAAPDGSRDGPSEVRRSSVSALIPGVGAALELGPSLHLFGGIHRGFSPPGPGAAESTRPESSISYETGARYRGSELGVQVAAFFSDYRNVLGQATLATGELGRGNEYNGGAVHSAGIEASLDYSLTTNALGSVRFPMAWAYTLTRATFRSSFESDFGPWGTVEAGDHLPYLPRHQLAGSLGIEDGTWDVTLGATASSPMRTQAGRGPMLDRESTDAFVVLDLQGTYELSDSLGRAAIHVGIQNLAGSRYVVARRPAGARPGLPRTLFIGASVGR